MRKRPSCFFAQALIVATFCLSTPAPATRVIPPASRHAAVTSRQIGVSRIAPPVVGSRYVYARPCAATSVLSRSGTHSTRARHSAMSATAVSVPVECLCETFLDVDPRAPAELPLDPARIEGARRELSGLELRLPRLELGARRALEDLEPARRRRLLSRADVVRPGTARFRCGDERARDVMHVHVVA